ncbi:SH3 domain-containing protein [Lachnospiraceae bacterium DSM 108991]|uniref:SH3 domain-containing protein n=1 Tax=Claveliimonas monacensis TaxID=2779351 RepID=A0ABR9RMB8_9FIRM|nr:MULTISPECIES: glycosyl hydrolase family 18 protein [Lachnospiraceae]MBE5064122.1 SH3 domain-containing protein [Claveliimonas monacensis]
MDQRRRRRRPARGRKQSRRRRKRNLILKTGFFIIVIIAAIAAFFLWRRYGPSDQQADRNEYYGIESDGQLAIVVNNEVLEPRGMISDGRAYVEYAIVRDYINQRFYWDPGENVLLYTLPTDTVSVGVGASEYTLANQKTSTDYVILRTEGSTAYIALDFVAQYTDMSYEVFTDPDRAVVVTEKEETVAEVKRDTQVRYQGGVKSPILTEVSKGDTVAVIEDEGDWKKVRTQDGFIGYLKQNRLRDEQKTTYDRGFEEPVYTNISKDYVINMAWHNVTNSDANSSVLEMIASTKGLNTISPTWFHVADTSGNLESIASSEYVNYAHQSNIEVWAAIRDFDGGISSQEESYALLSSTSSRTNLINQLMAAVFQTGIDGINVDFEMISEECGEHYIQFIRELSVQCRKNNIVLSVDNYVPQNYNQQYHRGEQGAVADYVVIMGYDEHYGGSPEAGSVASYDFVKAGIENTLEEVPAEKVINAVPFFTRVWEETPKTEEEIAAAQGTDAAEYTMNVTSTAYGMADARAVVEQAGAQITWDETTQQNYATWEANGVTYEVWLEDAQSLEPRLKLMKDYGLAGTAAWRLGQETSDIWELILQYVN